MSSEFKYLVNPTDKTFEFQYNSHIYDVPAKSRKLFLKEVADHGEKRSYVLTDPEFDADGNVISVGNDILKYCYTEEANTVNPVGQSEPILVERSKETVGSTEDLLLDKSKLPTHLKSQVHSQPKFRQADKKAE